MKKILITGANGFVGKNLTVTLKQQGFEVLEFDLNNTIDELSAFVKEADFVVHLAGINRPMSVQEFYDGNANFTVKFIEILKQADKKLPVLFSSSIQAELQNDYGISKKMAEDEILKYGEEENIPVYVYRLTNVYGKWCRPNYNSVVATFCHNIAHGLEITVNDPSREIDFVYIDDVVAEFIECIKGNRKSGMLRCSKTDLVSIGELRDLLVGFSNQRKSLEVPVLNNHFQKCLYSTYLSYLPEDQFSYPLKMNVDQRGSFTEFIRTPDRGQVSINISHPGIVKGNHWHHTKNEKFLVVKGTGVIRFRKIDSDVVIEYPVSGDRLEVVDIPVGYTHNIENTGTEDMITVMWANEAFDPDNPDTFYLEV